MNKNIIIKGIAALTILTSVTGVSRWQPLLKVFNKQQKPNIMWSKYKTQNISPYKGIVRIGSATGFVVGKNTILTNKHVLPGVQVGGTILASSNGENDTGGYYKVKKKIIPYAGSEDLAIVQVEEDSVYPKNKNSVTILKSLEFASGAQVNDRLSIVGYLIHIKISIICFESTGKILSIDGNQMTSDAFAEGGNSGSPVFNSNHEVIAIAYAVDVKNDATKIIFSLFHNRDQEIRTDNTEK